MTTLSSAALLPPLAYSYGFKLNSLEETLEVACDSQKVAADVTKNRLALAQHAKRIGVSRVIVTVDGKFYLSFSVAATLRYASQGGRISDGSSVASNAILIRTE
jgi:hypothetical protein